MTTVLLFALGLVAGYGLGSYIESFLHEYVSDAPPRWLTLWRRFPFLSRIISNTYFSHHVIHHFQTFRRDHVTQFASSDEEERLHRLLQKRGRHGQVIIDGGYATRLHGSGALVFALPAIVTAACLSLVAPVALAIGAAMTLSLPPLFSYFIHPYLHMSFEDGQRKAHPVLAALLRTGYARAIYRNHFLHHHYGGTSNYNLVLGADYVRGRMHEISDSDVEAMRAVGMPVR